MLLPLWLIFALIVGALGHSRRIGFWLSLILSLILSPLIGLIIALLSKTNSQATLEAALQSQMEPKDLLDPDEAASKLQRIETMKANKLITESEYQLLRKEIMSKLLKK